MNGCRYPGSSFAPLLLALLAASVIASGCSYDGSALGSVDCDTTDDCPSGSVCDENYVCVPGDDAGVPDDAGPDVPDADDCSGDEIRCDGECVDVTSDIDHCGECANLCDDVPEGAEPICDEGTCGFECIDEDLSACDGQCVDYETDDDHCGSCGEACEVDEGVAMCDGGVCIVDTCDDELTDCSEETPEGELLCADLDGDPAHCDGCGNDCAELIDVPDHAHAVCDGGKCDWECNEGYWNCAGECVLEDDNYDICDGACVDLDATSAHCGECDNACDPAEACSSGGCVEDCPGEQEACDGICVDTQTHTDHCRECGQACDDYPDHASPLCTEGGCDWECDSGYFECGGECLDETVYAECDGECIHLDTDPAHCGACDNACDDYPDDASPLCTEGSCDWVCDAGYSECDDQCFDAFDTVDHCGGCGIVCDDYPDNAAPLCDGGGCTFECQPGYTECGDQCISDGESCDVCDPDHPGPFGGGEGLSDDPYLLCATTHLAEIDVEHTSNDFLMTTDIAADGSVDPIGDGDHRFDATFDGGGYEIAGFEGAGGDAYGFFRYVGEGGTVKNLTLSSVDINAGDWVGGLVGVNEGHIENAAVYGDVEGDGGVGGLVGANQSDGLVEDSLADAATTGDDHRVGGLVGRNNGVIESSDALGDVEAGTAPGISSTESFVGGLVGDNNGEITDSISEGDVNGSGDYVGGFVGINSGIISDSDVDNATEDAVQGRQMVGGFAGINEAQASLLAVSSNADVVSSGWRSGGLVGRNHGDIEDAEASGDVDGGDTWGGAGSGTWSFTGGLVGDNQGSIEHSDAVGHVEGSHRIVGGLAGRNTGQISDSSASGDVEGDNDFAGGLVGHNDGAIVESAAHGNVYGDDHVGGLAGRNYDEILRSYATGNAVGGDRVGGLVGRLMSDGQLIDSYATGDAQGDEAVGGLVGRNRNDWGQGTAGLIQRCYAFGSADGDDRIGGLVGWEDGTIDSSFWNEDGGSNYDSTVGESLTSSQFDDQSLFEGAGWDFDDVWEMGVDGDGNDRPLLQWQP